ncbi:MAG: hypothetical protein K1X85_05700 [Ignavibacteria bacterium]|nr:hypothetical protein [Ignavibacteria bacterium]
MQSGRPAYSSHLIGGLIYMTGDTIAALITGDVGIVRSAGMFAIGSTLYAFEIRNYFRWIEKKVNELPGVKRKIMKTMMALTYFNPLWIARHLCFIYILSGQWALISAGVLKTAALSFMFNIPVSVTANYIIQNRIPLTYRFWASAVFSGLMAIYYSMSGKWF